MELNSVSRVNRRSIPVLFKFPFLVLKAFKLFLHCLIFKVHRGALPGVVGSAALLFYHILFRLSRTFFEFFLDSSDSLFWSSSCPTSGSVLYHISFGLSRTFFAGFFKAFLCSCLSLSFSAALT